MKANKIQNMKTRKVQIIIGVLTFPIILGVFFLDRLITAPMFWLDNIRIGYWLEKPGEIAASILRCLSLGVLLLIISIFI